MTIRPNDGPPPDGLPFGDLPDDLSRRRRVRKDGVPESIATLRISKALREEHLTDAGNAQCMALLHSDKLRYCHTREKWLVWDGQRWALENNGEAYRVALDTIRSRQYAAIDITDSDRKRKALSYLVSAENNSKLKAMLASAIVLPEFATTIDDYDRPGDLMATPAGTLDLGAYSVVEPRREDLITRRMGATFDPSATAPRWHQFLREVFAEDEELIAFMQRAAGYSLTPETSEQCLFLCWGSGLNGKSKYFDGLRYVWGDYADTTPFNTFDADRTNEAANDLAKLRGARLVTAVEGEETTRLAESRVKAVTGQDAITCRFLYHEFFTYVPQFKLWLATNHKPVIRGTDRAIWRRIRLIPFTQSFAGREDKHLEEKLKAEASGILNWVLEGTRLWREQGLGTAKAIEAATEEYRKESDLVGQWIDECCRLEKTQETLAGEAFKSYFDWCKDHGYRPPTETGFARRLTEIGFNKGRNRQGKRVYFGFYVATTLD